MITPQNELFTDGEILKLCFSYPSPKSKSNQTMQKLTYTGDSNVIQNYKLNRSVNIKAIRQASKLPSIIIFPSHLTDASSHLAAGKGITKAFLVETATVNGTPVNIVDILDELRLRPTIVEQIVIAHDAAFDENIDNILKLFIVNESIFCDNEVHEIVGVATKPDENGAFSYVFDCYNAAKPVIINGTTEITLDGIGTAHELNIKVVFGVSYGIF